MLDATLPTRIRFRLLGEASLAAGNGDPFRLSTQKGMALLAYLAMHPGRSIGRSVLADLLWGDRTESQARQNLRQTLLSLRRDLGPGIAHALLADDQSLMLRAEAVEVDALAFAALADAADPAQRAQCLDQPWGPFLESFSTGAEVFDQWVASERQRLDTIAIRTFAELADRFDAAGDGERAIRSLERLIAIDPAEEERHRRLISLEARYRGRDAALARAKSLAALLARELDAEPEPATLALVEDIRASAPTRLRPEDIRVMPPPDEVAAAPAPSAALTVPRWSRMRVAVASAAVALTLVGVGFGINLQKHATSESNRTASASADSQPSWRSPPLPSRPVSDPGPERGIVALAVLPFTTRGGEEAASRFADMIADDLTNLLSRGPGLRVISRQTSETYRGQPIDAAVIGAELDVRYLLEGNVQLRGGDLVMDVALINVATRQKIWSGHFDRRGVQQSKVADEIVNGIGRELHVEVTQFEGARGSSDPDVHALVFRGRAALFDSTKSGLNALRRAEDYFTQALARDPDNAGANIGLAGYHIQMAVELYAPDPAPHLDTAEALLRQVIERQPRNSAAHGYMGLLHIARGRVDPAIESFERTIELNPSAAMAYAQLGRALLRKGRSREALEHIHYALRLSPHDPAVSYWLGFAGAGELDLGNYDKAIAYLDRALTLTPGHPRMTLALIATHAQAGHLDEARRLLEQLQKAQPHISPETLMDRFFGSASKRRDSQLTQGFQRAIAALGDSWKSPPLSTAPDLSNGVAKGVVALVVLPFTSYGESGEPSQFADMMTDDLTNVLSRIPGIRVISRNTAETYRSQRIDAAAIGAELGVRYLLEGRVSMRESQLRVNVELTNTKTRLHVWSGRFDLAGSERHRVQAEIVNSLGRELQVEISQIENDGGSPEADVHALIIKGWLANNAVTASGPAALKDAGRYFTQALERDPNASRAVVGLAAHYIQVVTYGLAPDPAGYLAKAEAMLKEQIERRPRIPGAHYYLGAIHRTRGEWADAVKMLERELALNPSHAPSYGAIGYALVRLGRPEEGLEHARYAMRLSPRDHLTAYWLSFAGAAELELGRTDKAIEHLTDSRSRNPSYGLTLQTLAAAYAVSGGLTQARSVLEDLHKLGPQFSRERLIARFGDPSTTDRPSNLRRGLQLALGRAIAAARDSWKSPRLPSSADLPDGGGKEVVGLVVLPFMSSGESSEASRFADMMTDDLTNLLSRVPGFRVISRNTAETYRNRRIDASTVGTELGVRYLLEGRVSTRDDYLRVNVELTNTKNRSHAWSAQFELAGTNHDRVQAEILHSIGRELQVEVMHIESEWAGQEPSAHQRSLRAWRAFTGGTSSMQTLQEAKQYFTEELERDPDSPRAAMGLAAAYVNTVLYASPADTAPYLAKAEALLKPLIERGSSAPGLHYYMAAVYRLRREWAHVPPLLERELAINPSHATSYAALGHALIRLGRAAEGLEHVRYAMRLSPRDPALHYWLSYAGAAELELKHYDKAIAFLDNARSENPRYGLTIMSLAAAHALSGHMEEARRLAAELGKLGAHFSRERLTEQYDRPDLRESQLWRGLQLAMTPAASP
jgi:TolB-like protein/DNA-binding SARP family transcriptional activator